MGLALIFPERRLIGRSVDLRLATEADAEFILTLRMDPQRNRFLSPVGIALQDQQHWLRAYQERERQHQEYYFIIQAKDALPLGTVRIYDLRADSFCWGSWIVKPGAPARAALEGAVMIYEYCFFTAGYPQAHFDVRRENEAVNRFHQKMGATLTGNDALNNYYIYLREAYSRCRPRYRNLLPVWSQAPLSR